MWALQSSSDGSTLASDIWAYYWYQATTALALYRPVMFLYFRAIGLTWTQIAVLEAVGGLTTILTEVPTGYVGNRLGRLRSLLVGTVLVGVALAGIGVADSFLELLVWYPLWSLGWNFRSGSNAAWLYDRLAIAGETDRFVTIKGRGVAAASAVGVVGALLGGWLGTYDLA